jgi:hypothetical protein
MGIYHPPVEQHETVVATALGVVQATHYSRTGDRHEDAAYEYAIEQLALASRALAEAVERMPADEQPIGWTKDREVRKDPETERADHFREAARLLEEMGHDDDAVNLLYTVANGIAAYASVESA